MTLPYDRTLWDPSRELRREMTPQERVVWSGIRRKQIHGVQFYRQKPLGPFIVDFYCARAKLVVEIDGGQHFEPVHRQRDAKRDQYFEALGVRVLRFSNATR